jgi:hypothetical protein
VTVARAFILVGAAAQFAGATVALREVQRLVVRLHGFQVAARRLRALVSRPAPQVQFDAELGFSGALGMAKVSGTASLQRLTLEEAIRDVVEPRVAEAVANINGQLAAFAADAHSEVEEIAGDVRAEREWSGKWLRVSVVLLLIGVVLVTVGGWLAAPAA